MKFHYRVDLEIPDEWIFGEPTRDTYRKAQSTMLTQLRGACALIVPTTDSSWNVEAWEYPKPEPRAGLVTVDEAAYQQYRAQELAKIESMRGGGTLERPEQINIDARHAVIHRPEEKMRYARCGNCGQRYEITGDPTENHHRAMQHKTECARGGVAVEIDRRELSAECREQPMQQEFRKRRILMLENGERPSSLDAKGVPTWPEQMRQTEQMRQRDTRFADKIPSAWWKFWRWFR